MAKTTRQAAKRAAVAGRNGLRARKSGVAKAGKPGLRKPKPAKTDPRKPKSSLQPETVRLKRQLKAARMQQEASAEILRAVANASGDAAGPLQLIAETTARLFKASSVSIQLAEGSEFTQEYRVGAIAKRVGTAYPRSNIKVGGRNLPGTVVAENRQIHIPDLDHLDPSMSDFPGLPHARAGGARTVCGTPLRREHKAVGALIVFRDRLLPFTGDELALLQSYADQAVIAIENARLFNDVEARTRDLTEALLRQTATADVLKIVSRSVSHAAPVFETIIESCQRLFDPFDAAVYIIDGEMVKGVARRGSGSGDWGTDATPLAGSSTGLAIAQRRPLHFPDLADKIDLPEDKRDAVRLAGGMTVLYAPIISESRGLGSLVVTRRPRKPFTETEIEFIQSFADQAAIAIENARLFNETREALERQAATSDILRVISQSPTNVQPVFDAIVLTAVRLTGCDLAFFLRCDGATYLQMARATPEGLQTIVRPPQPIDPDANFPARAIVGKKTLHLPDWSLVDLPAYERWVHETFGIVSSLYLPLLRAGECMGLLVLAGKRTNIFGDREVALAESFRDQAVIAIENVRLFDEVQAKTRDLSESLQQQTATADVLKVISRSAFDLQTVLETLIRSAVDLCGANRGIVTLRDGDLFHFRAHSHPDENPDWIQFLRQHPQKAGRNSASARSIQSGETVCVPDVLADPEIDMPATALAGIRAVLAVPLLRDGKVEGLMVLSRPTPGPFNSRQIDLVQTFADQAVIAIENVRLFDEVQARTRDLTEALTYQTGSSNILKVIASSPTDVTPVLQAIVESACELCEANDAIVYLRDGDDLRFSAHHGPLEFTVEKWPIDRATAAGRAFLDRVSVHIRDVLSEEGDQFPEGQRAARRIGVRTMLGVPLLREGESIGTILLRRTDVHPFTGKQVALLQTFADQAVIAIGNVRLFEEVQAKTRELSRSLDDLRTAQDRLVQTEKLASLGQLTAGIAHEIKNPLNFVNNFSALSAELIEEMKDLLSGVSLDENKREDLDEIMQMLKGNLEKVVQHGKRADSIVKNMLLHSREGSGEQRAVDINALLEESLNLAYHGARAEKPGFNINLQRDFDPVTGLADVYPQEITRVLLNVISNGFYAATRRAADSGDGFEPTLRAATKNLGDRLEIRIRDNGTGIAADVKEKIFNPFFTTKPAGEGTGLGLSMSHDIVVKQHGGTIDVVSEPGIFAEFIITLPRTITPRKTAGDAI